ncbi:hypothetical protein Neosp_015122 [[Neocosmospora] mangrovei]
MLIERVIVVVVVPVVAEVGFAATGFVSQLICLVNAASSEDQFYDDFRHREISNELGDLPIHWGGAFNAYESLEEPVEDEKTLTAWGSNFSRVNTTDIAHQEPKHSQSFFPD